LSINIVYTLNDKFIPQVAASIESVLNNSDNSDNFHFFLISEDLSDLNKKKLKHQLRNERAMITFISLTNLRDLVGFDFDTGGWNSIVLARLFLDKLLPESIEKVIYLDGDTIIRGSLSVLWETNLTNKVVAMAPEPTVDKKRKLFLGLGELPYCNAGVLLLNIKLWRIENCGKQILDFYNENNGKLFANDQDALNAVLKDKRVILSPTYNYFNIYDQYSYKVLSKLMLPSTFINRKEFSEVKKNPIIIHYLGEERPWRIGNKHRFKLDFENNLNQSEWSDMTYEEGWGSYFKLYYLFNKVTKPFPMIRYNIMNLLIPWFIRMRAKRV